MDKQINHDKVHDESKTKTHRLSKLPDDGDPWAPTNHLLQTDCKQSPRIGKIRALNGCTWRLFTAATRHNHKNSDIESDITICLHRIKIYQISDLSFLVVTKLPSHATPVLV